MKKRIKCKVQTKGSRFFNNLSGLENVKSFRNVDFFVVFFSVSPVLESSTFLKRSKNYAIV